MVLPDFLTLKSDGEIVLQGHRVGLFHIVNYYREGFSPEMLACQYPTVPLALIHKIIAYYLENQPEVEGYVANCRAELDAQALSNRQLDVAALRERLTKSRGAGAI